MEVNNLLFNYISKNIPKEILGKNSIFEGEVLDLEGEIVYLKLDGEIMMAKTDIDISQFLGKNLKFIVKEKLANKLVIRPITEDTIKSIEGKLESTVDKILDEFNLEDSPKINKLILKLLNNKLPLDRPTVEKSIKILTKIEELLDLDKENIELVDFNKTDEDKISNIKEAINRLSEEKSEEEKVIKTFKLKGKSEIKEINRASSQEVNKNKSDNQANLRETSNLDINREYKEEDLRESNFKFLKEFIEDRPIEKILDIDIRKILLNKNEFPSEENNSKLNLQIKDFLKNDFEITEDDVIELTEFLIKNDIKPSLNNIRESLILLKEPEKFIKETKDILKLVDEEDLFEKFVGNKPNIKNIKGANEKEFDIDKLDIKEPKEMFDIRNKLEFIKDLNKEMFFYNIPINYGREKLEGFINIIKEKNKNKGENKPFSVFISLDTNNLGNIKINCLAHNKELALKIGIREEDQELFKSLESILKARIEKIGYRLTNLEFDYSKDVKLVDNISSNENLYFLDIRV